MRWLPVVLLAAGCGSGAVSGPPPVPPAISVSPSSATAYPGIPTSFFVSGGTGAFDVVSDNQAVIQTPAVYSNSFTIVPGAVTADTQVNLTLRSGSTSIAIPVTVKPLTAAPLAAAPAVIAFQGVAAGTCASNIEADVIVSGGRPPYAVSQPGVFVVVPAVVTSNPGRFTVRATGQCAGPTQIAVVDTIGASVTISASNALSSAVVPTPPAPTALSVTPGAVSLTGCTDIARVIVVGGQGNYLAASGNNAVLVSRDPISAVTFLIRRGEATQAPAIVPVAFSDGQTSVTTNVALAASAQGVCP